MTILLMFIALGLINWFGTVLVVDSEFFRPIREWIESLARYKNARFKYFYELAAPGESPRRLAWWYLRATRLFWNKFAYMINCHMCGGTWIGLALVPWAPHIFGVGVFAYVLTAILIKAIGHGVFVMHVIGEQTAGWLEVRGNGDDGKGELIRDKVRGRSSRRLREQLGIDD